MPARKSPRRTLGGLELRSEFDLATLDVLGRISFPGSPPLLVVDAALELGLWCGRTIVFRSSISVGVISEGSINGNGRLVDFRIWLLPTIEAHCSGRPTYLPSRLSKPVCTRCSKLLGNEICGFFFFFENMASTDSPYELIMIITTQIFYSNHSITITFIGS